MREREGDVYREREIALSRAGGKGETIKGGKDGNIVDHLEGDEESNKWRKNKEGKAFGSEDDFYCWAGPDKYPNWLKKPI